MTFLQPFMLMALPLVALPIIIHLIHLYRRRHIKWAAMIFLRAAQQMNKGLSRLRQILILALRVLAVAAIILAVGRPLAGGWLGLTGGAPDTVLVLLDRSASMEQKDLATGLTKRVAGLRNMAKAINDTTGGRSHLVLIDSALGKSLALDRADALLDVPQTEATDTAADIPGLLQAALDYITTNKTGRTDVWLLSDLQQSDWDPAGGRWQALRSAFAQLQGVRFHLLCYPEPAQGDLAVSVDRVTRHETADKAELLMDLRITRRFGAATQPVEVPLRFVVAGVATTARVTLKENQLALQGYSIPIDKATRRGWGRVELPADACPENNVYYFVFDELPPLRSVIVSDDAAQSRPLSAALSAAADPARKYIDAVLPASHAAEIPWPDTALIVWQAPLPKAADPITRQLRDHVSAGRSIIFLPPDSIDSAEGPDLFGMHWDPWKTAPPAKPAAVQWWRNDSGLLANTRDGTALPVGTLEISRYCTVGGEGTPLARISGNETLLMRSAQEAGSGGSAYFLGTLPDPGSSSLARDGVVMFALLQRALNQGAGTLGKARQSFASASSLGADPGLWHSVEGEAGPLHAGVAASGGRLIALNRPPSEDTAQILSNAALTDLFSGLDFRILTGTLSDTRSLTNEVWRTFLVCMALAILGEALLCLPAPRKTPVPVPA